MRVDDLKEWLAGAEREEKAEEVVEEGHGLPPVRHRRSHVVPAARLDQPQRACAGLDPGTCAGCPSPRH